MNRLLCFTLLIVISCSTDAGKDQYQLTVQVLPEGSGIVEPDKRNFDAGKKINIKGQPNKGYRHFEWSGDLSGDINPVSIVMDSDKFVSSHFKKVKIKSYGGDYLEQPYEVAIKPNGNIVLVGSVFSSYGSFFGLITKKSDAFILELNDELEVLFKTAIGGSSYDEANSVIITPGGDYVVSGVYTSDDGTFQDRESSSVDIYISKIDKSGQIIWLSVLSGNSVDHSKALIEMDDGYVLAGLTYSEEFGVDNNSHLQSDIIIAKFDEEGNEIWVKNYGGSENDEAIAATKVDQGFLVTGFTISEDGDFPGDLNSDGNIFLIRFNNEGEIVWEKSFGGSGNDIGSSILVTPANDLLLIGYTNSRNGDFSDKTSSSHDIFVMKLDANGNKKWVKLFGGSEDDKGVKAVIDKNGDILITGETRSTDRDFVDKFGFSNDIFLMKLNSNGEKKWIKTFKGSYSDFPRSIKLGLNDEIYIYGNSNSSDYDFEGNNNDDPNPILISITD